MKTVPGSIRKRKKNIFFFFFIERVDKVNLPLHRKQKKNEEKVEDWDVKSRIFLCKVNQVRRTADLIALFLVTRCSKLIRSCKGKVSFFGP